MGQSPSVATLLRPLEGYGQFLYVDRGYAFFAPDPGPSHLIQVALTDRQGSRKEIMFPDLGEQRPRLLYHRHFMLTEFLYEIYEPPLSAEVAETLEPSELEYWQQSRSRYQQFRQSMVHHLETVYPDHRVEIRRIEHLIPDLMQFLEQPVPLDHPDSYRVLLDQPIDWNEPAASDARPAPAVPGLPQAKTTRPRETSLFDDRLIHCWHNDPSKQYEHGSQRFIPSFQPQLRSLTFCPPSARHDSERVSRATPGGAAS